MVSWFEFHTLALLVQLTHQLTSLLLTTAAGLSLIDLGLDVIIRHLIKKSEPHQEALSSTKLSHIHAAKAHPYM